MKIRKAGIRQVVSSSSVSDWHLSLCFSVPLSTPCFCCYFTVKLSECLCVGTHVWFAGIAIHGSILLSWGQLIIAVDPAPTPPPHPPANPSDIQDTHFSYNLTHFLNFFKVSVSALDIQLHHACIAKVSSFHRILPLIK